MNFFFQVSSMGYQQLWQTRNAPQLDFCLAGRALFNDKPFTGSFLQTWWGAGPWRGRRLEVAIASCILSFFFYREKLLLSREPIFLSSLWHANMTVSLQKVCVNRSLPNILITGTPGTGKTTTSELLASQLNFKCVNVGDVVKEKQLHYGFDSEFDAYIIDEDRIVDELEDLMSKGGVLVDHHGCDFFPERWFDLVVVLRSNTTDLYDRLKKRQYSEKKLRENMECEIMRVVAEEAREFYAEDIVVELESNSVSDLDSNVDRINRWVEDWVAQTLLKKQQSSQLA